MMSTGKIQYTYSLTSYTVYDSIYTVYGSIYSDIGLTMSPGLLDTQGSEPLVEVLSERDVGQRRTCDTC